ncbi:MAG: hypothetical protein QOE86_4288, partial [Solirubrobacteraceae bacterium]|nr:hypothetical protein [Solirubrobacteraceae bacterium]
MIVQECGAGPVDDELGGAPGPDARRRPRRHDGQPVTGSLNASLAQWLLATGRATAPYV